MSLVIDDRETGKTVSARYQRSKIIIASNITVAVTLFAIVFIKLFLPQSEKSEIVLFFIALEGFGLAATLSMAQYGYHAWFLDLRSFIEWHTSQQLIPNDMLQDWFSSFPGWNIRSQYRVMGPIGFLVGCALVILGIVGLVAPLFTR